MNERHEPAERELPTQPDGDAAHLAPTVSVPAESIRADENRALRLDDRRRRRRALIAGGAGLAVLIAVAAGGVAYAGSTEAPASASPNATTTVYPGDSRGAFGGGVAVSPYGGGTAGGSPRPDSATTTASAAQTAGVVTITSDLGYQDARSAGTGIILTADGMILTNNHVVEGATAVSVTVESTGRSYSARVVGTDSTNDIAVLHLDDASGLTPATLDADGVSVGDVVTAVGNAGGTGDLVAASGTVTALDQRITTQSESGIAGETLTGLIQTDADIVSGDSGGPLVDSAGRVVGIDTAASSGTADITGFAIPIAHALDIVAAIEAGADTATVQIGYPAFLGVSLSSGAAATSGGGAVIGGVVEGAPAAAAGLEAGDTITAVDGAAITSAEALSASLAQREPGESVTIDWVDTAGATHSAQVVLAEGPVA
ncbi:S1C family serine protease [Rathayibacter tanaceti]|uniref:Trypsin-like serine protease n=2 Tax=Rathayibacter tanaceti TaxID=1671680 RepID=A0AAE6RHH0_9MICO|nr:trypsin-like peptidase domain-containing protein [Rathayibacter tanaceti]QHC54400.1 trypsin-like serine protease [Rathayibacter tanaceti]